MSVRYRLATAPWPVWSVLGVVLLLAINWPFVLVRPGLLVYTLIYGVVFAPVQQLLTDRQRRERTGWDRRRRADLMRAAGHGSVPVDPAEREQLRELVAEDYRVDRVARWVCPVVAAAFAGALVLWQRDLAVGWVAAGVAWYCLLGAGGTLLAERRDVERRTVLVALAPSPVGGSD